MIRTFFECTVHWELMKLILFNNTEVFSQNSIYHNYHVISSGINKGVNQHFTLESDILNWWSECWVHSWLSIGYQENSLKKLLHVFLNFEMLLCLILGRKLNIKLKVSEKAMGVLLLSCLVLVLFTILKSSKFNVSHDLIFRTKIGPLQLGDLVQNRHMLESKWRKGPSLSVLMLTGLKFNSHRLKCEIL